MPYVLPQVQVFQDFTAVPAAAANPLRAHISGPHAYLLRYADEDERPKGRLGFYDRLLATAYDWPDRPAGGIVDTGYVKLWMEDALLKYFEDSVSSGSTITKVAGYNNRVRSATVNFADNGEDYPLDDALLSRDVQPGDVVKVRGVNGDSESVTLWTYVKRLIGDTVAAEVGAGTVDSSNPATQAGSSTIEKVSGPDNCITLTADVSGYNGLRDGNVTETYDIIVTASSLGGDLTTAKLRVISGSGDDDVAEVTPAAFGAPTDIGENGLQVTFDLDSGGTCSTSADDDDVSAGDLIVGQRWQVTVNQEFTKPTLASSGTYSGTQDTTYIITVTRGGTFSTDTATQPQVTVTTTNGIDLSGPVGIAQAGDEFDVGTKGIQGSFTGTGLRTGDKYYIEAAAEFEGPMRTIELGNNLDTEIPSGSEVDVTLFIRKPLLQIGQNRTGFAPLTNWDTSELEITVNDGIVAYDETWTDGGVQQPLDVYSEESKGYGELFVEYRAWLPTLANEIGTIQDVGTINDQISGALHPDNPLKWGVFKALENANGAEVKFTAVADPDDDESWVAVLSKILGRADVYGLVPLTRKRTVLDLYAAHVLDQSTPSQGLWRVLWTALEGLPTIPIVSAGTSVPGHTDATTTDGEVCLAVIEDDPNDSGTQYTIVRVPAANGAFLTNGVRAGDVVRCLFTGDGFGNASYSEFVVDEVQSEDQLRLLSGPDGPVTVAAKIEIWRNLTATEESAAIAVNAGAWGNRRIRAVWPDTIESSGTIQEGYFLCAALAGLSSGVLPHQGLTNLEITGFTDVSRTLKKFNRAQLDVMAEAGTWIVTQDPITGQIFTRHAVTTGDNADINQREEMVTRNVDSMSFRYKDTIAPFIGVTNVTPTMQARLELQINKLIDTFKSEGLTVDLGGQLIDGQIVSIGPSTLFLDRYVIVINNTLPYPFNNADIHLVI